MKNICSHTCRLLIISFLISGCATIFGKSHVPVSLRSTPTDAMVVITNRLGDTIFNGKTPSTVILKSGAGYFRKASYEVKFFADGYQEKIYPIEFGLNGWYFGNIFIGGAIGMLIVDPLTGAMWTLPKPLRFINATLSPLQGKTTSISIYNVNDLTESLQKQLIRLH